jgi:DNA (cytosine-5)-methyltransferase 1
MSEPARIAESVRLTVGSLFSGIGGFDLGLERAGMEVIWHSEIEPYACKVLAKHWPAVPNLGDITKIDWSSVERPDVLCGGFPCQPVSKVGRQRAQADARWLWPDFAAAIRSLRPGYVFVENVEGLLGRGANIVLGDLASLGFDAEWDCIPASAVGAPHERYRLIVVAYAQGGRARMEDREAPGAGRRAAESRGAGVRPGIGDSPDMGAGAGGHRRVLTARPDASSWWAAEPGLGRLVDGVPPRMDRMRCLGNAVVPQLAEWAGRRILAAHSDGQEAP